MVAGETTGLAALQPGSLGEEARVLCGEAPRAVYGPAVRVDNGAWHHVVVVFDRDVGITVHVDAVALATPGPMAGDVSNAASLLVGKASGYPYWDGDLDEVALYAGALPAARVQAHYDAGRAAG